MPRAIYKELLDLVRPLITRQDTNFRRSISPEERLSLTIRYLTTGVYILTVSGKGRFLEKLLSFE